MSKIDFQLHKNIFDESEGEKRKRDDVSSLIYDIDTVSDQTCDKIKQIMQYFYYGEDGGQVYPQYWKGLG